MNDKQIKRFMNFATQELYNKSVSECDQQELNEATSLAFYLLGAIIQFKKGILEEV
jgi:hypothetical protein